MLSSIVEIIQVRSNAKVSHASNSNFHIYDDWTECENPMKWFDSSSYLSDYHDMGYPRVVSFNWHPSSSLGKGKRKRKKEGEQYATRLRRKRPQEERKKADRLLSLSFSSLHSAPLRPHPLAVSLLKNAFTEHSSSSNFSSGSYFSSYLSLPCKRSISFAPIHPPTYLPSMQLRFCSSHFLSERTGKSPRLTVEELSCQRLEKLAEAEWHA